MAPFYGRGSATSRLQSHYEKEVYFLPQVPRSSWYSFDRPRKDERLSRPWIHPVILNTGPLDWESSALTTRRQIDNEEGRYQKLKWVPFPKNYLHRELMGGDRQVADTFFTCFETNRSLILNTHELEFSLKEP